MKKKQTSKNFFFKVCVVIQFVLEQKFLSALKQNQLILNYFFRAACAAASLAIGTRKGEQDT